MSGTIFFVCSITAISAPLVAPRISAWYAAPTMTKRIQNQKEEERVVSKSRPAGMNISYFITISTSTASSPTASKSPGMPIALVKPNSKMSIEPSSFDATSTSQVRLKDAYLGGLMENQRWDPSHQEEENSEDSHNPAAETWYCITWEHLLPKIIKLGSNPLHTEPVFQMTRKVKRIRKRHGTTISTYRRTHRTIWKPSSPWSGRSVENDQAILWKIWMWSWTLRAAVHLGKDYDMKLTFVKNYLWKTTGQFFRETEKLISGQTETTGISLINFQDLRWVSKLIAQSSLSIFHCQSLCLLRLCALFGENGRQFCWILEEANSLVCGQQLFQRVESNWWTANGTRVEDFQGFTTVAIINEIQQMMGELQSMFNDIVWDAEGNDELCVNNSFDN